MVHNHRNANNLIPRKTKSVRIRPSRDRSCPIYRGKSENIIRPNTRQSFRQSVRQNDRQSVRQSVRPSKCQALVKFRKAYSPRPKIFKRKKIYPNAFLNFMRHLRSNKKYQNYMPSFLMQLGGRIWQRMGRLDKAPYIQLARIAKKYRGGRRTIKKTTKLGAGANKYSRPPKRGNELDSEDESMNSRSSTWTHSSKATKSRYGFHSKDREYYSGSDDSFY